MQAMRYGVEGPPNNAEADARLIEAAPEARKLLEQAMERLRLGYAAVAAANKAIIYCSLVGYGQDGPYAPRPAYDDLIQAATAIPALASQNAGGAPPRPGTSVKCVETIKPPARRIASATGLTRPGTAAIAAAVCSARP